MQDSIQVAAAQNGLTLKAYRGDGGVLVAFDLDQHLTSNLAGFALQCTPPNGPAAYLLNRLSFDIPITAATTPQERQWTPSNLAPFQKFRWMHFPADLAPGTLGVNLYKPGQSSGVLTSFAFLKRQVPKQFQAEWGGGMGQVIHDKFIVVDFNDHTPLVFTGSSNLAEGGEAANGDNLLAIADRATAIAYAVEAIRLVDHYHFRASMQSATEEQPLKLKPNDANWWAPYYDSTNIKSRERTLFSR
jgi:hypothetical protein